MAYHRCRFCHGAGCLACEGERERDYKDGIPAPIFVAKRDNPDDMEALRRIIGADAVNAAFQPGGGGIHAIERQAVIESLLQVIRGVAPEPEEQTGEEDEIRQD